MPATRPVPYPRVIHSLTALRYVAAVWVVVFHFAYFFPDAAFARAQVVLYGRLGVDFFFVLSGFVIAHVYLGPVAERRFDYWGFMVRRFARIYPLHALTLAASVGLGTLAARQDWPHSAYALDEWTTLAPAVLQRIAAGQVLLVHAWGVSEGLHFNLPSWSISAEWFAYLTFPISAALLTVRRPGPVIKIAAIGAATVALDYLAMARLGHWFLDSPLTFGVTRIVPEFAIGVLLREIGRTRGFGSRRAANAAFAGAMALVLVLVQLAAAMSLVMLALALLIFAAADAERHGGLRALCRPFPVLLGEVSYAVYMFHFLFGIVFFDRVLGIDRPGGTLYAAAMIALAIALITVLSWVSHRLFELPTRTWLIGRGRSLSPRLASRAD